MSFRWMIWMTAIAMLFAATAAGAAGRVSITGFGGLSKPTGDFSDEQKLDARLGFQAGGAVDFMMNDLFALGLDGSWSRSKHGAEGNVIDLGPGIGTALYDKDKFTTAQFGLHAKYFAPTSGSVGIFGLVGLGMYKVTEKWEGTISPAGGGTIVDNDKSSTDSRLGFRFGLGASHAINEQWSVGAEGDYNVITENKDDTGVSSLQYMGLRGMLTLHLPE